MAQSEKSHERDPLISLSTQVVEPAEVEIDDDKYQVYGQDHIGRDKEIRLMTLFKNHERAQRRFDTAKSDSDTAKAASLMRDARIDIITEFSTIPEEVADKLPLHAQGRLLDIIATEMGFAADDEDEEA